MSIEIILVQASDCARGSCVCLCQIAREEVAWEDVCATSGNEQLAGHSCDCDCHHKPFNVFQCSYRP